MDTNRKPDRSAEATTAEEAMDAATDAEAHTAESAYTAPSDSEER